MDRTTFMESLRAFHESQGRAFRPQKVSGYTLDPYKMFLMIVSRGGFSRVNKNSRWFIFGKPMGIDIPEGKQQEIGFAIKNYYINWLRDYEKALDDNIKLAMAAEFAANNPQLVPNPGLAFSSYNATLNNNNVDEAPLTRSAAASLSRNRNEQVKEKPDNIQPNIVHNFSHLDNSNGTDRVYLIPYNDYLVKDDNLFNQSNKSQINSENFRCSKYPISDDIWYLLTHLKDPNVDFEHIIHIINNFQILAINKKLFISSFPTLINDLSEIITICTFSIDSIIPEMKEFSFKDSLNIDKLKIKIDNKSCLLNIDLIHKHLLASISSLISLILNNDENLNYLFDLNFNPNINRNFLEIKNNNLNNEQESNNNSSVSLKNSENINQINKSNIPSNSLKSHYLKNELKDHFFQKIKDCHSKQIDCKKDLQIINLNALYNSLMTAFRTSSNIIFLYEKYFHEKIVPIISNNQGSENIEYNKKIVLKVSNNSKEFYIENQNNVESSIKQDKFNYSNDISIYSLLNSNEEFNENSNDFRYKLNSKIKDNFNDDISKYLSFEMKTIWITISSIIDSFNQLIPVILDEKIDQVIILLNAFIQELFRSCQTCCDFSTPSLNKCMDKIKGCPNSLPCLIYNEEGFKFLSDLLEFGCNIIINISSVLSNKLKYNQKLINSFYQTLLKLSSICIAFYSSINKNNTNDYFHSKKNSYSEHIIQVYNKLVLPISLATIVTISENVSFNKLFQSFNNLNYHYLSHHTQFTQSLIENQSNNKINQEILNISDSNDSFVKDQILILWGREIIGPILELLKTEMTNSTNQNNELSLSCLMLSQYIIYISSELMSWNVKKEHKLQNIYLKSSREIAIGILTPFIDIFIELAWLPTKFRNLFWSIVSELSKSGVSNPSVTLGLTKINVEPLNNSN